MVRVKRPPLPSSVRRTYTTFRVIGGAAALFAAVAALWALSSGLPVFALLFFVLGAAAMTVPWLSFSSRWNYLLIGLPLLIAAWLLQQPWLVILTVLVIVIQVGVRLRRVRLDLDVDRFEVIEPTAIMGGAEEFVAEFEALGFRQVAAIKAPIGRIEIIVSHLISADRSTYASVTDAVISLTSVFEQRRRLVTRNTGQAPMPPWMLPNTTYAGSPNELAESHAKALGVLADHGWEPITLDEVDLTDISLQGERDHLEWVRERPPRLGASDRGDPLWGSPDPDTVVQAWADASPPKG